MSPYQTAMAEISPVVLEKGSFNVAVFLLF